MEWTTEQQQVIDLRNRNILVSAAAGSGKTAVLVERIIARLTKDVNPIDVDELLIVTFTEAAASEMKERVLLAIEKKLSEEPDNVHLQRQEALIHNALITTIHSFCLSVIREHFHVIDLDPVFRIGEEGELKLLKKDVMDELLEEEYEKKDPAFLRFVERYATGRDDKKIEELILQIYEFSRSYPNPSQWLKSCVDAYEVESVEELVHSPAGRLVLENIRRYGEDAVALLEKAIELCEEADGPYMYLDTLKEEKEGWIYFLAAEDFSQLFARKKYAEGGKLKANRDKAVSKELAEAVKDIRKQTKGLLTEITKNYLYQSPEELVKDMQIGKETTAELVRLTEEFAAAFSEKKRNRNLIDFGDMEQLALQILTEEREGELCPSAVAEEYQKRFQEIMIDEYQDSNLIQEAILTSVSKVSRGEYNIFMVGDVKQSIYSFRLSRPELFMDKYEMYDLYDGVKQRIDLHKNFRSRPEVLDSTNYVFRQIMTKELGGISYDENAALYFGAEYYKETKGNETEILIVDTDMKMESAEGVEETARELEARAVASRIKNLMEHHLVTDKVTGELRNVQYKDIVILTRSLKGWTDVFTKVLNREGIPTYTGSSEGYFETLEIETILNYLRVLDNPEQDIPLTAVLTSSIVGMTGEELAIIRSFQKELGFSRCVKEYLKNGPEGKIKEKLESCFEQIAYFREMIPYTAIHELLWKILERTGYYEIISAMPGGEQRSANMDMLLEKAKSFESTSYKGLFNFVRYIEQLKKYEIDYGEAEIMDEQADTVRLMSIHKSKGLEFPIVFVAGMSKRFNKTDITRDVLVHSKLGIGVDCIELEKRTKTATFLKKAIQREVQLENLGEELRVLYVAMTRAKEKLILIGSLDNVEKKIENYESLRDWKEEQLSFSTISGAGHYFDWVLPCYLRYPGDQSCGYVKFLGLEDLVPEEIEEEHEATYTKELLLDLDAEKVFQKEFKDNLEKQFSYIYPYENTGDMKLKFTVSELKKRQGFAEENGELLYKEEVVPILPKKLQEQETVTGAGRGTAYHKILELLDFTREYDKESFETEIEILRRKRKVSEEMYKSVRVWDILQFLQTDVAKRMHDAALREMLHKEQPFVLGVNASDIYPENEIDETLLVQGIIDVWFEEEDGLVVLDYKTDRVTKEEELKEKYSVQLDYYAQALERVTGKPVKEKIIYSFALRKEIFIIS